ncbi:BAR domain-containing protein [Echinicola strongylocentroti]|uniref:hypothetical protein n=1 Tax=Echinicola strongylocentroti TaxID=1795355 RepID=UPI0013A6E2F1|nr:hypothetical protein [Echinicola strongylocentroti]
MGDPLPDDLGERRCRMSMVIEKLKEVRETLISTIRVIKTDHDRKQTRINSLQKKKYELTHKYRAAINALNAEIKQTRNREDFKPSETIHYRFSSRRRSQTKVVQQDEPGQNRKCI